MCTGASRDVVILTEPKMSSSDPNSFLMSIIPRRDPRTVAWLGAGNWPMLAFLLTSFVLTVKVFLPRFMKNRKPFQLTNCIRVYNLILVAFNAYFLIRLAPLTYLGGNYSLFCQGIDTMFSDENTPNIISLVYYYSIVRIVEFMDTIFFVLRKKFNQASTLNVSHHCISVALPWWGLAYGIDGQVILLVLINMGIHVIMYFYYFLSSFGPSVRRFLFWKKYLTRVQIAQFIITAIHNSVPLVIDCHYPKLTSIITLISMLYFAVMFGQFYTTAYNNAPMKASNRTPSTPEETPFPRRKHVTLR